jgi:hypothetical protein
LYNVVVPVAGAVKLVRRPETEETVILCRSADRRPREQAMHDKFSRRIETALGRLAVRKSKKRLDPAKVNRQIGRILQQNQRAAAHFSIALEPDGCSAGLRLTAGCNTSFDDSAALSEGAYLLRSNIDDWTVQQLWKAYTQLTQVEAAFRIQKGQLNLRPIWHQHEDRVPSAFLPSCYGRPSTCGSSEQASEIRRVRSSKSLRGSSRMTWSCRPPPRLRSACAASLNPTPHKPPSSTALASSFPNACASPSAKRHSSP